MFFWQRKPKAESIPVERPQEQQAKPLFGPGRESMRDRSSRQLLEGGLKSKEVDDILSSLKPLHDLVERQAVQSDQFAEARALADEGKLSEAIAIVEGTMYQDGLRIRGVTWPFVLSDLYIKAGRYDDCWRYLNWLTANNPKWSPTGEIRKIKEVQAKVLRLEGRHLDALYHRSCAILVDYAASDLVPSVPRPEAVARILSPCISRAGLKDKKDAVLALVQKYLQDKSRDERGFRDELWVMASRKEPD